MNRAFSSFTAAVVITAVLSGCSSVPDELAMPLMGLKWFDTVEKVKDTMSGYVLANEREKGEEDERQLLLDYKDIDLFDIECDLTVCLTDSGLVGLNYHDIGKNKRYREWFDILESKYGYPTEESRGMSSWYDNPIGKNTAIYLFNLEEGVQVSFYVTADNPDKGYTNKKKKSSFIPDPELRTPVIRDTEADTPSSESTSVSGTEPETQVTAEYHNTPEVIPDDTYESGSETGDMPEETTGNPEVTTVSSSTASETSTSSVTTAEPEPEIDRSADYKYKDLEFYESTSSAKKKLSSLQLTSEYNNNDYGQPEELIQEYSGAEYLGNKCDLVLCFTNMGLVGINYFCDDPAGYNKWLAELTKIYGTPDNKQYDYACWDSDPVGSGTTVYVFLLEDGVQISFFSDE